MDAAAASEVRKHSSVKSELEANETVSALYLYFFCFWWVISAIFMLLHSPLSFFRLIFYVNFWTLLRFVYVHGMHTQRMSDRAVSTIEYLSTIVTISCLFSSLSTVIYWLLIIMVRVRSLSALHYLDNLTTLSHHTPPHTPPLPTTHTTTPALTTSFSTSFSTFTRTTGGQRHTPLPLSRQIYWEWENRRCRLSVLQGEKS